MITTSPSLQTVKSNTACFLTPAAALMALGLLEEIDEEANWIFGTNSGFFPENFYTYRRIVRGIILSGGNVKMSASKGTVIPVNQFLKNEGMEGSLLKETDDPSSLYAAAVIALMEKFKIAGQEIFQNTKNGQSVSASLHKVHAMGTTNVKFLLSNIVDEEIFVTMETENYDLGFYMMDRPIGDSFALYEHVNQVLQSLRETNLEFSSFRVPMIDLSDCGDLEWLKGAQTIGTDGLPAIISQAKFHNIFKMDNVGFLAKSSASVGADRGMSHGKDFTIDRPFVVFVMGKTDGEIYFAAHVGYDGMKRPNISW
ncbi:MAG: hypothetical protein IPH04_12240 [Saprospirales bacterium]|nr:hypothetical protein [Saprospirales bacterium]